MTSQTFAESLVSWKFLDISVLRDIDLFKSLSEEALVEIIPLTSIVEFKPGETVFSEGEMGDALFLILSGEVRISKNIHGVGEEALAFLKKGSYFGEMSLVGEQTPRSASAICAEKAELAKLERTDFEKLINSNHKVGVEILWSFVNTLSARLRESNDRVAFFAMSNMFE